MARPRPEHPPAAFTALVAAVDPVDGGRAMTVAHDVLKIRAGSEFLGWSEARAYIDALLSDPTLSNADLKGLLNRSAGPVWGMAFDFGADAKAARRYLEALSKAIAREME